MCKEQHWSHAWLSHLADVSEVGAIVISADGDLDLVTEGALRNFGRRDQASLAGDWDSVYRPQLGLPAESGDRELWRGSSVLAARAELHGQLQLRIYEISNDDCVGYLGLVSTVNALAAAENAQALAERHRNLNQYLHSMVHELRTPLNAIGVIAQDLLDRIRLDSDEQPDHRPLQLSGLQSISDETQRLSRIVQAIAAETKPMTRDTERFDIGGLIDEVSGLLGPMARAGSVNLHCQFGGPGATVEGSRDLLKQALVNCIVNAVEAVRECELEPRRVDVIAGAEGSQEILIKIEDTGPGFDSIQVKHAFDPYFTTRASGTGLGLHLAREYIESFGGAIEIRSRASGARLDVRIPAKVLDIARS